MHARTHAHKSTHTHAYPNCPTLILHPSHFRLHLWQFQAITTVIDVVAVLMGFLLPPKVCKRTCARSPFSSFFGLVLYHCFRYSFLAVHPCPFLPLSFPFFCYRICLLLLCLYHYSSFFIIPIICFLLVCFAGVPLISCPVFPLLSSLLFLFIPLSSPFCPFSPYTPPPSSFSLPFLRASPPPPFPSFFLAGSFPPSPSLSPVSLLFLFIRPSFRLPFSFSYISSAPGFVVGLISNLN